MTARRSIRDDRAATWWRFSAVGRRLNDQRAPRSAMSSGSLSRSAWVSGCASEPAPGQVAGSARCRRRPASSTGIGSALVAAVQQHGQAQQRARMRSAGAGQAVGQRLEADFGIAAALVAHQRGEELLLGAREAGDVGVLDQVGAVLGGTGCARSPGRSRGCARPRPAGGGRRRRAASRSATWSNSASAVRFDARGLRGVHVVALAERARSRRRADRARCRGRACRTARPRAARRR